MDGMLWDTRLTDLSTRIDFFNKKKMEKTAISVNLCEEKYFLINCVEEKIWGF